MVSCSFSPLINVQLLSLKIHYFIFFAALSCVLPFRTVFVKKLGLSATAVGVIFLAVPFLKVVSNPLLGYITDYFKKFRFIIATLMVAVAVSHLAMLFVPPITELDNTISSGKAGTVKCIGTMPLNKSVNNNFYCGAECDGFMRSDLFNCTHHPWNKCNSVRLNFNLMSPSSNSFCPEIFMTYALKTENSIKNSSKRILNEQLSFWGENFNDTCKILWNQVHYQERFSLSFSQVYSASKVLNNEIFIAITKKVENNSKAYTEPCVIKMLTGNYFTSNNFFEDLKDLINLKLLCSPVYCNSTEQIKQEEYSNEFLTFRFWSLFILLAVSSLSFASVCVLIDTVCYEMLRQEKSKYGYQRLWGTIGWGVASPLAGYLNQVLSTDSSVDYSLSFYLLAALIVLDLIPIYKMEVKEVKYSYNIFKDVGTVMKKPLIIIDLFVVYFIGVISGLLWNYQFWFMEEIGSSQVLLGLSQLAECIFAELPCFVVSGWVIRKLGYDGCNCLTLICFGFRYLCFSYMTDPWMSLPVALLQGPTFGIFFASMTMYAKENAPAGTEASLQSLFATAFEGLGAGTGSILGGIGFDAVGSRITFLYSARACFIFLAIYIVFVFFYRLFKNKQKVVS